MRGIMYLMMVRGFGYNNGVYTALRVLEYIRSKQWITLVRGSGMTTLSVSGTEDFLISAPHNQDSTRAGLSPCRTCQVSTLVAETESNWWRTTAFWGWIWHSAEHPIRVSTFSVRFRRQNLSAALMQIRHNFCCICLNARLSADCVQTS